jgi:hypothetical protein
LRETRAPLGAETQRQWSDQAIATVRALRLSQGGHIPVPVAAWYRKAEPPFADCLALVRMHLWRARYVVNSTAEAELRQLPQEALDLLSHGFPFAA